MCIIAINVRVEVCASVENVSDVIVQSLTGTCALKEQKHHTYICVAIMLSSNVLL